jgi:hypothetical protein
MNTQEVVKDFESTLTSNLPRFNVGDTVWMLGLEPGKVVLVGRTVSYCYGTVVREGKPVDISEIEWFYQVLDEWIPEKVLYTNKEDADEMVKKYKEHLENLKKEGNANN